MFTHLLIATDGSELAPNAETTALALEKHLGAREGRVSHLSRRVGL